MVLYKICCRIFPVRVLSVPSITIQLTSVSTGDHRISFQIESEFWTCCLFRRWKNRSTRVKTLEQRDEATLSRPHSSLSLLLKFYSLSIRRFWGKGERWKRKRERGEGEKRLTQMLLLEPSTPTQHDSIPSNQNHFRSLGCQLHVSKSSPKINLSLRSGRAPVLVLLRFRFFLKPPMRSFRILVL